MNKYFKHYLYGVILLAFILSVRALNLYKIELSELTILTVIFGMLLEVIKIQYNQDNGLSFQNTIFIFASFIFNSATCITIVILSIISENIIIKIKDKEIEYNLNYKVFFNLSSRILSVLGAKSFISSFIEYNSVLTILGAVIIYILINYMTISTIIYLSTNKRSNAINIKSLITYIYISFLIVIALIYGYKAYGNISLLTAFMLLVAIQQSLLGRVVIQELKETVLIDSLTKAYNRASLNKIIWEFVNSKIPFTIIFIDFNNFKTINDTYGHDVGDQVLVHFVDTINSLFRKNDKIYRYGGDEFCMIVKKDDDLEAILEKLNKIKNNLIINYDELTLPYSFSYGTFHYSGEKELTAEKIIKFVSKNLGEDKKIVHALD